MCSTWSAAGPARSGSPSAGGAASRAAGRRAVRLRGSRRDAVAEAPVDRALGGPQRRDRLAARADVLELAAHHRGEQAAPAVGGHDAHRGHRGARHDGAGHRHVAAVDAGAGDDASVVEPRQRALRLVDAREGAAVLLGHLAMEGRQHGVIEVVELLVRGRTHLHGRGVAADGAGEACPMSDSHRRGHRAQAVPAPAPHDHDLPGRGDRCGPLRRQRRGHEQDRPGGGRLLPAGRSPRRPHHADARRDGGRQPGGRVVRRVLP